jgi:hypothetical protein
MANWVENNVIVTLVNLLVLLCELFIKAGYELLEKLHFPSEIPISSKECNK